jgi:DNA-binding transcriptional ArsR family regulator
LFIDPRRQMYVRELARRCDVALSAVQQELANLVGADLLRRRSDSFHVFYRANRKHTMFVDLQQLVIKSATPAGKRKVKGVTGLVVVVRAFSGEFAHAIPLRR